MLKILPAIHTQIVIVCTCKGTRDQALLGSLLDINVVQRLAEAHLLQLVAGEPLVLVDGQPLPVHLVLVPSLQLAASVNLLHNL